MFATAIDRQHHVLAAIARILQEEKVTLSDAAVRAELERLLADEVRQCDGVRELGQQTLGKRETELTEGDMAARNKLSEIQDACGDRFRRLMAGIKTRVDAQPDSPFAKLAQEADADQLDGRMTSAGAAIRANQLGRGLAELNEVVAALRKMVGLVAGKTASNVAESSPAPLAAFAVPLPESLSEVQKSGGKLAWAAQQADALGKILRALRRLEELAKKQRAIATQTQSRAAKDHVAADLAREEWDVRLQAMEVASDLAALDPQLEQMIRAAATTIERATPVMEKGPLSQAVAPAQTAADQLESAARRLGSLWKELLELLKDYAEGVLPDASGTSMGKGSGSSGEQSERLERMVFQMIRATSALTDALHREEALVERTVGAKPSENWAGLKKEQDAVAHQVVTEVVPNNISPKQLPQHAQDQLHVIGSAADSLADAMDRAKRVSSALQAGQQAEAAKREKESAELMGDALQVMVQILQVLMGETKAAGPPSGSGTAAGMALDPSGTGRGPGGYEFKMSPQQMQTFQRSFSGSFPQRYDHPIKIYYQAITREPERTKPGR